MEEGRSSITLGCVAEANPPGRVFWRKFESGEETRQYLDELTFDPVTRSESGTYICQAENSIGLSNEEPVEVNVLCKRILNAFEAKFETFKQNIFVLSSSQNH